MMNKILLSLLLVLSPSAFAGFGYGGGSGSSYTFSDSVVNTAGTVTLVGDSATPGASKYYGTNSGSTLGYYSFPSPAAAGATNSIQYNNAGAFGGFGAWDGTNLSFGSQYLNGDGSIGNGSSQDSGSVAVGINVQSSNGASTSLGEYISNGGGYSTVVGHGLTSTSQFSILFGYNGNDSQCASGYTFNNYNHITNTSENWMCLLAGSTAHMPRALIPPEVTDDGVSALQIGGSGILRLAPQANGVTPTCNSGMNGALSETNGNVLCVCNGTNWKSVAVLATTCTF
jgi:hypothetical protein